MINKYTIGILAVLAAALGGFYVGRGQKQVEIQEKVVTIKGETLTVYKDRIVTVTRIVRPDGTTEETTRTEEKEGKTEEKIAEKKKEKESVTTSTSSQYSLGLKYWASFDDKFNVDKARDTNKYEVTAGYRVMGDVWLEAGYRLDKQVSVGLRLQL